MSVKQELADCWGGPISFQQPLFKEFQILHQEHVFNYSHSKCMSERENPFSKQTHSLLES